MSRRDPEIILRQMLDHANEAVEMARGRKRDHLDTDRMFSLAVTHLVEIIGEAAGRMPVEIREKWPRIQWAGIVGMRNRLIHGYDIIDLDIVWRVVTSELPLLIGELEKILSNKIL